MREADDPSRNLTAAARSPLAVGEGAGAHDSALPSGAENRAAWKPNGRLNLGLLYVFSLPIAAALVHFLEFSVGSLRISGLLWLAYLLAAFLLLQAECSLNPAHRSYFPWKPWAAWGGYVWLSLLWCDGLGGRNLQDALQITMPLLVGITASMFGRRSEHLRHFLVASLIALGILLFRVLLIRAHVIDDEVRTGARVFSITAVFLACIGTALAADQRRWGHLVWLGSLLVTAGTGSRMTTGVILLLPVLNPLNRHLLVRGALCVATLLAGVGLFYTPQFQQRFFYDGHGTITQMLQGDFLSFGRFEAWPAILDEAMQRPWRGAGVGEVVEFVPTVWPEEDKPHNDYLRVLYETGWIGLCLITLTLLWQQQAACRASQHTTGDLRVGFGSCALALRAFALLCLTDNVLIYNLYYNNLVFGLLGLCYGVAGGIGMPSTVRSSESGRQTLPWVNHAPLTAR